MRAKLTMNVHLLIVQVLLLTTPAPVTCHATLTERKATFEKIYQKIVDQYNNRQSYFSFIATVQTTFCPDQPICARTDSGSITDVSSTAYIKNLTLVDDIHDLAGICCLPCSCEDTCVELGSCCMTKTALRTENDAHPKHSSSERMCIPTTSRSYFGNSGQDLEFWYSRYSMITQCPDRWDEEDAASKCEKPFRYSGLEAKLPVTSLTTGETYWNYHCARCNNDYENIIMWNATAILPRNRFFYFTNKSVPTTTFLTFKNLYDTVFMAEEVVFTPPNLSSIESARCYPTSRFGCPRPNSNSQIPENEFMSNACEQFNSPISIQGLSFYRNVFCFFCTERHVSTSTSAGCTAIQQGKYPFKALSSLFNFKLYRNEIEGYDDKKQDMRTHVELNECNCDEVFDNYLKTCRPFFCPIGEVLGGCDCLSFVDKISDMPILLKLIVRPTDGNTLPTSETTILKLGAALQKAIQKSYTKINVKVFAIFKQEFMMKQYYVYTAIANTIKDYGVKDSFRSLAQVLDGPPFLQISQGKLNYNIELTNHVEVWFESGYDADKLYIVIRARELTTQRELTRIYQNDKAVQGVKRSQFQELSPLLYCKLIQLNEDEYKEQNGMVTLMAFNGSLEIGSTPNYLHVATNEIRVCTNEYIRPLDTSRAEVMINVVQLLITQMAVVCMLLCIWSLY